MVLNGKVLADRVVEKVVNRVVGQECALTGIPRKVSVWSAFCATMALLMANLHAEPCFTLVFGAVIATCATLSPKERELILKYCKEEENLANGDLEERIFQLVGQRAMADAEENENVQLLIQEIKANCSANEPADDDDDFDDDDDSGFTDEENCDDMVEALRAAVNGNLHKAQYVMSRFYECGTYVERDEAKSLKLLRLAADGGWVLAQCTLALAYANGNRLAKNLDEAIRYYKLAIEQNSGAACYLLAMLYETGEGVEKDDAEAVRLMKLAAENGFGGAECWLESREKKLKGQMGNDYSHDGDDECDDDEDDSYDEDDEDEASYDDDEENESPFYSDFDCDEMVEALEAVIEGDITKAQWLMSYFYAEGRYVDTDEELSQKLLQAAADGGNECAQIELGDYYASGIDVPKNFPEAVRYYSLAAKQGNPMACFNLARLYAAGDGIKKNESEAVRLMHVAADKGYEPAEKWLASREKIAKKKARKEKNKKKKR